MKKSVRDKRGFTLIELLVVIALMLSILGIAIVSLVGISNKTKEKAKEEVKEQIETAALEYFNANEYLFSNLKDNAIGTISVGKLVNDDYLNAVTNPVTGKKIGNCTIVVVKRNNNVFTSDVDDESFEKSTDNQTGTSLTNICDSVVVSNDTEIDSKITYYDENYKKVTEKRYKDLSDNKKLWFNSKHLGINKNLIACMEDEVEVKNAKGEKIEVEKNSHGYCATIKNGTNEDITYRLKDGSWSLTVAERVDTTPPIVSNLKVESENSYIGRERLDESKEYMNKFYSFKLIHNMGKEGKVYTFDDATAEFRRSHKFNDGRRYIDYKLKQTGDSYSITDPDTHYAEDIYVDGKLKLLKANPNKYEDFADALISKETSSLENNGINIVLALDESEYPDDVQSYYLEQYGTRIYYDQEPKYITKYLCSLSGSCFHDNQRNGIQQKSDHIINKEVRKIYNQDGKVYIYYTNQRIFCKINQREKNTDKNICVKVEDIYPKTLNINTAGIFSTLYRTIPHYSSVYDKVALLSAPAYANYEKQINGQLTKVSFNYKDETSKVYSYGLDKKYVKKVKRDDKYGDLISGYLTKTLTELNSLFWIKDNRDLYNYSYTTDKKSALKDNGLNEEYNKEVLNSVYITDLKPSENDYTKTKINKNSDSVTLEHIYANGELDGSIDRYNLNIKDNAGNEAISEADYEKYKKCTYKKWKVLEGHVAEQNCEDVCNKYGTLVEKRGTGMQAYVDEATGEFCSDIEFIDDHEVRTENSSECPWTDCKVNTTKKTTKGNGKVKEYTRKAFKFSEMDNFCSNTSTVSFTGCNSSNSDLNCNPNYPYKRYKFEELECSCTNDNGNITATSKNITKTTHPDGYSYIFYTSENNCNKSASEGKNNVKQVCQHKVGGSLDFHGVYWNQGSNNYWSGEGWYNNNYVHKKSVDAFTSEKKACEWACGKE